MSMDRRYMGLILVILLALSTVQMPMAASGDVSSRSPGADIVVEQVIKMAPNFPKVGDNVTLNATISNVGDMNATNITIEVQAINDTLGGPIDIGTYHLGSDWGKDNITDPSDAENSTVFFFFNWNTSMPGLEVLEGLVYTINVTAHNDTDDNLTNGTAFTEFGFDPPDIKDPFVHNLSLNTTEVIQGENVTINASFKNKGALPVDDEPVFFYVDYNWSGPNQDIMNTTVDVEQYNMSETYVEFEWNTTNVSIGNHTITVIIPSTGSNLTSGNLTIKEVPPLPGRPDLTVLDLGLNTSSVLQGVEINLTITIRNVGDEPSLTTKVNLTDLMGTYTMEFDIQAMDPDQEEMFSVLIDTGLLEVGVHNLRIWVDYPSLNEEWDEANNTRTISFTVNSKPDLVISGPLFYIGAPVTPITEAYQGTEVTVVVNIRNLGMNSSLNNTIVSFFKDNTSASNLLGNKTLLPYTPGANFNVTFVWNTSMVPPGIHKVLVVIDPDDMNDELDEGNNMVFANFTVLEIPRLPDLTIKSVFLDRTTVSVGDKVLITILVANVGQGIAEEIDLKATLESTGGGAISVINETVLPYMGGSSEQLVSLIWSFSESLALGSYVVKVEMDPDNVIEETTEDNNTKTTTVEIVEKVLPYTDPIIVDIDVDPSKPEEGEKVTITIHLRNDGNKDARDLVIQLFIDGKNVDEQTVPFLGADQGTANATFTHKFKEGGTISIRASVFESGVSKYSLNENVKVKKEEGQGLDSNMVLLVLVVLLVIAIIVTLVASGKKKRPDDDIEEEEEEQDDDYGTEEE